MRHHDDVRKSHANADDDDVKEDTAFRNYDGEDLLQATSLIIPSFIKELKAMNGVRLGFLLRPINYIQYTAMHFSSKGFSQSLCSPFEFQFDCWRSDAMHHSYSRRLLYSQTTFKSFFSLAVHLSCYFSLFVHLQAFSHSSTTFKLFLTRLTFQVCSHSYTFQAFSHS